MVRVPFLRDGGERETLSTGVIPAQAGTQCLPP